MDNQFDILINNSYKDNMLNKLQYSLKKDSKQHTANVAKEVESIFINIMLKSMRTSVLKDKLLTNDTESMYTDIYDQQISKKMSEKGFGLSSMIIEQIMKYKNK